MRNKVYTIKKLESLQIKLKQVFTAIKQGSSYAELYNQIEEANDIIDDVKLYIEREPQD